MTKEHKEFHSRYLEFSENKIEFCVNAGDKVEGSFVIEANVSDVSGVIYSSDTRMQCGVKYFEEPYVEVGYSFDGTYLGAGSTVRGEICIISNCGEYAIPYSIIIQKPILQGSLGIVKDLFHFANLAKSSWLEAVELFYSSDFIHIFQGTDRIWLTTYQGLSRMPGNQQNVEEFLIAISKKTPIHYTTDIEAFSLENVYDTTVRKVTIARTGWGYTHLQIEVKGDFIQIPIEDIVSEDFENDHFRLEFAIDAKRLEAGINDGSIRIYDSANEILIPVRVGMEMYNVRTVAGVNTQRKVVLKLTNSYVDLMVDKITKDEWITQVKEIIEEIKDEDDESLLAMLYSVQILLMQERFNEAKWFLEQIGNRLRKEETDLVTKCYYYYLTTFYNRDEEYLQNVIRAIENAYSKHQTQWRVALLLMYLDEEYTRNPQARWNFLENQFYIGCTSPIIFSEAAMLVKIKPTFLTKLDSFEQNVLWFAVKNELLTMEIVEHIQYLAMKVQEYTPLLYRILAGTYEKYPSEHLLQAICRLLIMGDKRDTAYFKWYALGIDKGIRITKLYEYYMYALDMEEQIELPKILLMYFSYQSSLGFEKDAYLYAYVVKNKERYPDIMQNYQSLIERFIVDQIKLGHINKHLAYLYQNMLAPQMLRDETAYAFTPLLFTHEITVENPNITSVVIIHEKMNGESIYPVVDGMCRIPIYGAEYQLFLQENLGKRFVKSIDYTNQQLIDYEKLLPFIGSYMEGRLSFDIYQCEADKNYITITAENVERFRKLAESEQVIDSFKKEIRTKLMHYYYDNDLIGELDTFLEETEVPNMDVEERAEFIRYLISRTMFDKAYLWIKRYGMEGVNPKNVARLVTKRIITTDYQLDEFLVNVAFYIFKKTRYDEAILKYLLLHYEGRTRNLRDLWKAAMDLELPATFLMERIFAQMALTGATVSDKNEILLKYEADPAHNEELAMQQLEKISQDYFAKDVVTDSDIFECIYFRYRNSGRITKTQQLALLKFWAEHPRKKKEIDPATIAGFVESFMKEDTYFAFYVKLADVVPQLHYLKDKSFIEYRTTSHEKVRIHYVYDTEAMDDLDPAQQEAAYRVEDMKEMYQGIYVKAFSLFQGESLHYYITEGDGDDEVLTQSDALFGSAENHTAQNERFAWINDILVSLKMQDDATADQLLEDYLKHDYCARELFRVL